MADKEIKRRIVLDGEKEYNAALKEVSRNLKTLRSELKAETAELGANATQQQKNEVRSKSLQKQIKEQEKAVKTYQEALDEVKEKYSDNEDAIAKWEQKLNDARATLANMKNSLAEVAQEAQGTGDALGGTFKEAKSDAAETVTATKSVADALGDLSDIGENVSSAIENIFKGCIDVLTAAVTDLWDLVAQSAAKANNWTDIAGYWGTDPQTIQQYARAVSASANSFDDLQSAVTKIVHGGKGKDITELLGISHVNYKNDWDYAMVVMDRINELNKRGKNLNNVYETVFGAKGATKVKDLVNDWDEIKKNLATFNGNKTGYGWDDKTLTTLNDLWVNINRIGEKWQAIKDNVAGGLGDATMNLLVNVEGSLDAIAKFLNADDPAEREKALEELRENVEEFFRKVGEIIEEGIKILGEVGQELQESDDPVVRTIGNILTALKDALGWIVDHQDDVIKAFRAIFDFWLIAKLASVVGKLNMIVLQMKAIEAFKGLGGAAAAAETAGGLTLGGLLKAGAKFLFGKALPFGIGLSIGMKPTDSADDQWDSLYDKNGKVTEAGKAEGLPETLDEYKNWTDEQYNAHQDQQRAKAEEAAEEAARQARIDAIMKYVWRLHGSDYTWLNEDAIRNLVAKDFGADEVDTVNALLDQLSEQKKAGSLVVQDSDIREMLRGAGLYPEESTMEPTRLPEPEPEPEPEPNGPTQAQKEAAEAFWDYYKEHLYEESIDGAYDEMAEVFKGSEDLLDKLDELIYSLSEHDKVDSSWRDMEDLPANWWLDADSWRNAGNNNGGITSDDLANFRGLPAKVAAAAKLGTAEGISNIKVEIDGYTAGRLLAPYVSEYIAQDILG